MTRRRLLRALGSLVVTGAATAYIVVSIDFGRTGHILANANAGEFFGALAIVLVTVLPMAWRWQKLLAVREIHERLPWLLRAYFVAYMAGQVLPTGIGGDAMRIYETSRRHPGRGGVIAASVLLERALGGAATLLLAAFGFLLALGHYGLANAYLWIELAFVIGTVGVAVALFARSARAPLRRAVPLLRVLKLERPLRSVYEGIHSYRQHVGLMVGVLLLTTAIQAVRVIAIWLAGRAVGVDLSPRPYYVMGPLLFLVMLVPFTINGLAVREAFFLNFLTQLGVSSDAAVATGFLFFLITVLVSLPGGAILGWENLRGLRRASVEPATTDHG